VPVGAVLVVGGGIAGYRRPWIWPAPALRLPGREIARHRWVMAQLDKTFPTNDCSMCILSPKLVECARHPNIELLTLAEVQAVTGEAGGFRVDVRQAPANIDLERCIACGVCAERCREGRPTSSTPVSSGGSPPTSSTPGCAAEIRDRRKELYRPHQGKGKCPRLREILPRRCYPPRRPWSRPKTERGAVILAPGFRPFDPRRWSRTSTAGIRTW